MAIIRHLHKPALFITFTANPHWPEIIEQLLPGQTADSRPDITSRVFQMKKKQLLDDLKRTQVFGTYRGSVYNIE